MPPPLAHLRVVELCDLRGALAGRILADLGADVVRVEPPGGDPDRLRPPFAGGVPAGDRSLPFLYRNAGKRGAVIDLADGAGWTRFAALCDGADVLIENTGADDRLHGRLAPEAVRARHPHLVHVTVSDFGRSGPRSGWRLEALPAMAASGALHASGFADRPPCWLPGHLAHDCAAIVAVTGALAALLDRARHGRGRTVEISVQEAALANLVPWAIPLADYARRYPVLPRAWPRDADGPALVLPAADGHVRILAVTPRQWRAFVALLANRPQAPAADGAPARVVGRGAWGMVGAGLAALAEESTRIAGLAAGLLARLPLPGALVPALHTTLATVRLIAREALAGRTRAEVLEHARRLGLPAAPVNTPAAFVAAEQTRSRGYFRATGFPHLGDAPFAPFPANLGATPALLRGPAPAPGENGGAFPARVAAAPTGGGGEAILAGVRVVSLGVGAVVPGLCRTLAELGAQVVKIESRAAPDFLRRIAPEPDRLDGSWMFNDENRGQQSVALDLSTPRGRELALALCARADVVAENRQGGLVARLGLDHADVRRLRPDVVYVSSQGYGRGGPLGTAPAFGPLNAAFAGATFLWNHADAPYPAGSSLEHPDHLAGQLAAVAVLAALEHRRRTGEGQLIELAQTEATAYLMGEFYLEGPCTGREPSPQGNAVGWACPHGVYPAAGEDRWLAIAVLDDEAFERFRRCLGWAAAPALATAAGRVAARAALDARVAAWSRSRPAEEAATMLQAADVSAMTVMGPDDLRADPHLIARDAFVVLDDPEVGMVRHLASPLRFERRPLGPAPRLGADTAAVLTGVLGLTPDAVARLEAEGVCR